MNIPILYCFSMNPSANQTTKSSASNNNDIEKNNSSQHAITDMLKTGHNGSAVSNNDEVSTAISIFILHKYNSFKFKYLNCPILCIKISNIYIPIGTGQP